MDNGTKRKRMFRIICYRLSAPANNNPNPTKMLPRDNIIAEKGCEVVS
jgi:hypothetical protein